MSPWLSTLFFKLPGWLGFLGVSWWLDFVVLSTPAIRSHDLLRALTDNFAHGLLAVWIWLLSAGRPTRGEDWLWLILCGASACAVDVDHFLAAGSWKLKAALNLSRRPFFHASSWWLVPIFGLLWVHYTRSDKKYLRLMVAVTIAVISHHLRDSHRRGLWFPPFGSTAALPWWLATLLACVLSLPSQYLLSAASHRIMIEPLTVQRM